MIKCIFLEKSNKTYEKSGTEAIRTQTQPAKPKREITNITNSQNTKKTHGQENIWSTDFPKGGHLATETELR